MEEIKRHQKYWDNSAEIYDGIIQEELSGFKKEAWRRILEEHISKKSPLKILEIGTGPGFFAILLAQMGHEVTALDFSEYMIKTAKKNALKSGVSANFIHVSHASPFDDIESYDVIVSRNVTWTLHYPERTYTEWYNWLKKDGQLLIFDANWNITLAKKMHAEIYQNDIEKAKQLGFPVYDEKILFSEGDEIAKNLPLTFAMRPEWDKAVLFQLGFRDIQTRQDFHELIYTKAEQVAYASIPLFSIIAVK
ncbi:class I SAM-dependent methyltransferase [Bacillus thuringiensis]|uniref:SAM-dependent methyltransferase n=1 Tax=Bacillus thuringiensis TaxID=1428 RepID=A0A9W3XMB6_BACTU|nr:class I SAM-dependent methyltransferase [Bacillus thuringiensis]AQY42612.1 SAM-dependent methyltransferase [Bacillus thuringiensis]MDR4150411.1 class I SAM-dependent methyltransferase [Bacillus thuringiensis]MEC3574270.1 class I SAM-dependent methyltransferase [Bacillus thuringiensis]MED2017130.1 class I SAM-dependent methyltransferase [Bacillus thuringiensis]MED2145107.1 class I SAM-dependent methyltransferase [Bacillus thuringiensis]